MWTSNEATDSDRQPICRGVQTLAWAMPKGGHSCTVHAQRPVGGWPARGDPENHPPPGELRPQGKTGRFRPHSGIFGRKHTLFWLIIWLFGLRKNLSSPAHGNTAVTAGTLAIGENGLKMAFFSGSAGTAHGAPQSSHVIYPGPHASGGHREILPLCFPFCSVYPTSTFCACAKHSPLVVGDLRAELQGALCRIDPQGFGSHLPP